MCPTRYRDILNPPTNTSTLNSPSPNTPLSFPSLPFTHTISLPLLITNHPPTHLISLNAALINARSLRNKIPSVISLMTDHDLDILFITETWLSLLDSPHLAALNTPPYCFIHNPRDSPHPGGGTAVSSAEYFINLLLLSLIFLITRSPILKPLAAPSAHPSPGPSTLPFSTVLPLTPSTHS